jgi:hypothetical protein
MSSSFYLALLNVNKTSLRNLILGFERSEVVVRRGDIVFKLPLKYFITGLSEDDIKYYYIYADISRKFFNYEKKVYRRLYQNDGIIFYLGLSDTSL